MQKFVIRLLDTTGVLLAWAPVQASAQKGVFALAQALVLTALRQGTASAITVEWTDLDIMRGEMLTKAFTVDVGSQVTLNAGTPVWRVPDDPTAPRPPVTEARQIAMTVPAGGSMGAQGSQ